MSARETDQTGWYTRPVLFVADLDRALHFYIDGLGFWKKWHEADGAGNVCQVNRGDCEIILCRDPTRSGLARLFIELNTRELAELRRELEERGVPSTERWWGYDAIRLADPDGNELLFPIEGNTEVRMRKQYYFRASPEGVLAWDVDRLIELTRELPRRRAPLAQIRELDEPVFGTEEPPTWRSLLAHVRLMDEADRQYPIILAADGAVMDGMHRAAQAVRAGAHDIEAVQFDQDPPPDHVGKGPDELPYPDEE